MKFTTRSLLAAACLLLPVSGSLQAADHLDAPGVMSNGALDINDLYIFQSPTTATNAVLIMTVNPNAGVGNGTDFDTSASYQFQVDNTGNAVANVTYTAAFTSGVGSAPQGYTITRSGSAIPLVTGTVGGGTAVGTGGAMAQAGVFDDPFFFDSAGFGNGLMFTGTDGFAGQNVSAIVLELPSSDFTASPTNPNVGVQAVTLDNGVTQFDRVGRPAINTVLIPGSRKDEFNQGIPANDFGTFGTDVQTTIESLNGGNATHAATVTGVLLADLLTFDASSALGFLNGRQLADDVIDAELTLLTNSSTPIGDGVDANDVAFLNVFPYLAPANVAAIPEPTSGMLLMATLVGGLARRKRRA